MPLLPNEQAAVALRLVAARYLDPDCHGAEDETSTSVCEIARGTLITHAKTAKVSVPTQADVSGFLQAGVTLLDKWVALRPDLARGQLALRSYAGSIWNGDGDGIAHGPGISLGHCQVGLLEIARLIEISIRDRLYNFGIVVPSDFCVHYSTTITPIPATLVPFRVGGCSDITASPRLVDFVISEDFDRGVDVVHLSYVVHHELICHAFQCLSALGVVKNASDRCHWTEGWMDAVAYDFSVDWVSSAPASWMPMKGDDAIDAIRSFHQFRYSGSSQLLRSDLIRRRKARAGLRNLAEALLEYSLAASKADADALAEAFSCRMNTHRDATPAALSPLAARMGAIFESKVRPSDRLKGAVACLAFISHEDVIRFSNEFPTC